MFKDKRLPYVVFTTALAGNAFATPPVINDDSATTQEDTSVIISVLDNDFDVDEEVVFILSAGDASNGEVFWDEESETVTYTPNPGFSGTDTFTYEAGSFDEYGETLERGTATVTVTVEADPDPEPEQEDFDTIVTGSNNKTVAAELERICEVSDSSNLADRCVELNDIAENNPELLNGVMRQIAPEEMLALKRVTSESTRMQMDKVSQRIQQRKFGGPAVAFSLNGHDLPVFGGAAGESAFPEFGVFASAHYSEVERDETTLEAGYEYTATGLTMGIDKRFTPNWVAGIAVGWTDHDLDYLDAAGSATSELCSVTLFTTASWNNLNLDFQIGTERGSFNTQRKLNYTQGGNTFTANILGDTDAVQYYGSFQVDYPIAIDAWGLNPYIRADYMTMDIDSFEETGGQGYELAVDEQTLKQFTFKAGLDVSYALSQEWGVLVPYGGVGVVSESTGNYGTVSFVFIEDPSQEQFELGSEGEETLFYMVRLGASAVLTRGWSTFGEYSQVLAYENTSAYQLNIGVRYEF